MSDTISKGYIEREGLTLKVQVYYSLGGWNHFTSTNERRGYYLSVKPVELVHSPDGRFITESYQAFTGTKRLLLEVKRKSKKASRQALGLSEEFREQLIQHVLAENLVTS